MTSLRAMQRVLIGVACAAVFTGCSGTSPVGPGAVPAIRSGDVQPTTTLRSTQPASTVSTISDRATEGRFLVCILDDNGQTQLSLSVWGMPGAVHRCLNTLNGRVQGIVTAPAPPIP